MKLLLLNSQEDERFGEEVTFCSAGLERKPPAPPKSELDGGGAGVVAPLPNIFVGAAAAVVAPPKALVEEVAVGVEAVADVFAVPNILGAAVALGVPPPKSPPVAGAEPLFAPNNPPLPPAAAPPPNSPPLGVGWAESIMTVSTQVLCGWDGAYPQRCLAEWCWYRQ